MDLFVHSCGPFCAFQWTFWWTFLCLGGGGFFRTQRTPPGYGLVRSYTHVITCCSKFTTNFKVNWEAGGRGIHDCPLTPLRPPHYLLHTLPESQVYDITLESVAFSLDYGRGHAPCTTVGTAVTDIAGPPFGDARPCICVLFCPNSNCRVANCPGMPWTVQGFDRF